MGFKEDVIDMLKSADVPDDILIEAISEYIDENYKPRTILEKVTMNLYGKKVMFDHCPREYGYTVNDGNHKCWMSPECENCWNQIME